MDKTKELIETLKKFYKYFECNDFEMGEAFMEIYADFDTAEKEFKNFLDLREKLNEIIKSLEGDENA